MEADMNIECCETYAVLHFLSHNSAVMSLILSLSAYVVPVYN